MRLLLGLLSECFWAVRYRPVVKGQIGASGALSKGGLKFVSLGRSVLCFGTEGQ